MKSRFLPWGRYRAPSPRERSTTLQPAGDSPGTDIRRLMRYQVANLQGLGTCERQEDAFAFSNVLDLARSRKKGLLAVLADGMGGMREGRLASDTAVSSIRQEFEHFDQQEGIAGQLYESILHANEKTFSLLRGEGGSTVVACVIYEGSLYFASVGDSYLYLKRNGQLFRMNRPQNILYREYLRSIQNDTMDPWSAEQNGEKAALSQFLGMERLEDVDFLRRPFPLMPGDILLLCSDGIAGVLTEEQLLRCCTEPKPKEICDSLEQLVKQVSVGQYQDNYTALVIQCGY